MPNKAFESTAPMSHVRTDDIANGSFVKVTREIPLPWLIAGVIAFIFNTAQSWQANATLEKAIESQGKQLERFGEKIERTNGLVISDGGIRAQKDSEHDSQILALSNRLAALESLFPRAAVEMPRKR